MFQPTIALGQVCGIVFFVAGTYASQSQGAVEPGQGVRAHSTQKAALPDGTRNAYALRRDSKPDRLTGDTQYFCRYLAETPAEDGPRDPYNSERTSTRERLSQMDQPFSRYQDKAPAMKDAREAYHTRSRSGEYPTARIDTRINPDPTMVDPDARGVGMPVLSVLPIDSEQNEQDRTRVYGTISGTPLLV